MLSPASSLSTSNFSSGISPISANIFPQRNLSSGYSLPRFSNDFAEQVLSIVLREVSSLLSPDGLSLHRSSDIPAPTPGAPQFPVYRPSPPVCSLSASCFPPQQPVYTPAPSAEAPSLSLPQQQQQIPSSTSPSQLSYPQPQAQESRVPLHQDQQAQAFLQPHLTDVQGNSKVSSTRNFNSLYSATIKNPQYRAVDFANLSDFTSDKLDYKNLNLALFTFGSLKHILFLNNGTLPSVSKSELNN